MAKLNKQEVIAVASKLQRELSKVAEESRKNAIKNYTPSAFYKKVKTILDDRDQLSEEYDEVYISLERTRNELKKILDFYVYDSDSQEKILNRIISDECKLPVVPTLEELKDEVTIAAIDDSFDTVDYIKCQLEKFK